MWYLQELLANHRNISKVSDPIEEMSPIGLNLWLIYVPQSTTDEYRGDPLLEVLKYAPLRFDSHVFGFYEEVSGNKKCSLDKKTMLYPC